MVKPLDILSDSGKQNGLEIFIIREIKPPSKGLAAVKIAAEQNYKLDYEAIRISRKNFGTFFSAELYVVVNTNGSSVKELHVWFGKDYKETPPQWINNLDKLELGWNAVTHFEIQNNECDVFENHFRNVQLIRYMDGRYTETNEMSRFYKIIRNDRAKYRVSEIPFNLSLMNQEDCFILDTSYNTRAYVSSCATKGKRRKSIIAANHIREKDHGGEGSVEIVDLMNFPGNLNRDSLAATKKETVPLDVNDSEEEDIPNDEVQETAVMHSLTKTSILNKENASDYPPRFTYSTSEDREEKRTVTLAAKLKFMFRYGLFYMFGKKQIKPQIKDTPREESFVKTALKKVLFKQYLEDKRLYVLEETVKRGVYIWVGKECDQKLHEEVTNWVSFEIRRSLECDQKKPARWSHAMKIPQGEEPDKFKLHFQGWDCEETEL